MEGYRPRPTAGLPEELGCGAASAVYVRLLVVGHSLRPAPNRQYAAIDIRRILPETVDVRIEQIERDNSIRGDRIRWLVLGEGRRQWNNGLQNLEINVRLHMIKRTTIRLSL